MSPPTPHCVALAPARPFGSHGELGAKAPFGTGFEALERPVEAAGSIPSKGGHGEATDRPVEAVEPATTPATDFEATEPATDFEATEPATDFEATEPATDFEATEPATDFHDYTDWCWSQTTDGDRAYLLAPRDWPAPCPWCGGRLRHAVACDELRRSWEPKLPFGRYRGKPLSAVPRDYLQWLLAAGCGDKELREAVKLELAKIGHG